jgi:cytidine deaminase
MKLDYILQLCDAKIELYKDIQNVCPDISGHRHIAFIIDNSNIMQYGYNNIRGLTYNIPVHAEIDAINKLKKFHKNQKIKIDILVLRVKRNGEYGMSKPCQNCIGKMDKIAMVRGYVLNKIYYSLDNGNFECNSITDLKKDTRVYETRFFRNSKKNKINTKK